MTTSLKRTDIVLACTVLFVLMVIAGSAAQDGNISPSGIAGPAFTDPLQIMEMPEEWKTRPVRYDSDASGADLVISLDQQMYPAFAPLILEYAKEHNVKIVIYDGTCGLTAGKLSKKTVDIGGYCCPPGLIDRLPGLRFHTIGISSLALIVHRNNPVSAVTLEQARDIFMGESFRWSELTAADGSRGPNAPIQPVGRLHCKLRAGHWRLLLDNEDLFSPNLIEVGAIPDMISQIAGNRHAIGYETLGMIRRFDQNGNVKVLRIDGVDPDDESGLLSGAYPLYRTYSLTTWENESAKNPLAQKVVEYVLKKADYVDRKFGLIPASLLRKADWGFTGSELTSGVQKERQHQ